MNAANAGAHQSTELQQLEPDGGGCGVGELGMAQADATQGLDENVGHCREPHAQLVGRHRGGRRAVGEQLELLADAVLRLAAGAIEILVEGARFMGEAGALERGDDKTRIGALRRMLGEGVRNDV